METKIQLVKYWYNYAKNVLTSSCIIYIFVGKYFKVLNLFLVWLKFVYPSFLLLQSFKNGRILLTSPAYDGSL